MDSEKARFENSPNCFLVNHGEFYGREILNRLLFVPESRTSEAELAKAIREGDIFFHVSAAGISAIGCAIVPAYKTPFPAWRYRECRPGDRGYTVETEILLLSSPALLFQTPKRYLEQVTKEEVVALLRSIFDSDRAVAESPWVKKRLSGLIVYN